METVKECIERNIKPGMIMTIGRGTKPKLVEIVSIERVPLSRNSIAVKDLGDPDRYHYYIPVDSLYFDNGYICHECTGAGCKQCYDSVTKTFRK